MTEKREAPIQFRDSDLSEQLDLRTSNFLDSRGQVARRDLGRYYKALEETLRQIPLSDREALLICDLSNGTLWDPMTVTMLWAQVADSLEEGYDKKWGVDGEALTQKLRKLNHFQCQAVVDAAERFWAENSRDLTESNHERVRRLFKIKPDLHTQED